MNLQYKIAIVIIIIEFGLVLGIAIIACVLKILGYLKEKNKKKIFIQIGIIFVRLITSKNKFDVKYFPRKWLKLDVLVDTFIKLDAVFVEKRWKKLRKEFIHQIILPLARKMTYSPNWIMRFYAAESFNILYEKTDETYIHKLVLDKIPIISLHAANAAIAYGSKLTVNAVIDKMSKKRWVAKTTYLQTFDNATDDIRPLVETRLQQTKVLEIKTSCYAILMKLKPFKITWDIIPDTESTDLNLKLAATQFFAYADIDKAIPHLIKLLQDKDWEVRLLAIQKLRDEKIIEALNPIAQRLHDSEWWVRINAAEALKSFGNKGESLLNSSNLNLETLPFNVAKHNPSTWW